jgi:hypothetical protein|uniref:Uncharacterized protein n=1 Tax=viral metagenome TaxID=1070528 RepID=A0A6C0ILQ4_9ZZZZ
MDAKSSAINDYIMNAKNATTNSIPNVMPNLEQGNGFLSKIGWKMWILIIILFTFLGVNIFLYLAQGSELIASLLKPFFGTTLGVAGETVDVAAEGGKSAVDIVGSIAKIGLLETQSVAKKAKNVNELSSAKLDFGLPDVPDNNTLNRNINIKRRKEKNVGSYEGNDTTGQWCYVGEYNGIRNCRQLEKGDVCMSGNIFPNRDICINPTLRA